MSPLRFNRGNLLIVEDDPDTRDTLDRVLTRYGHKCRLASDGQEGLETLRKSADTLDLVITDWRMPKMTGNEFFHIARREKIDVPFMFLSAEESPDSVLEVINAGAYAYLCKPIDFKELIYLAGRLISSREKKESPSNRHKDEKLLVVGKRDENSGINSFLKDNYDPFYCETEAQLLDLLGCKDIGVVLQTNSVAPSVKKVLASDVREYYSHIPMVFEFTNLDEINYFQRERMSSFFFKPGDVNHMKSMIDEGEKKRKSNLAQLYRRGTGLLLIIGAAPNTGKSTTIKKLIHMMPSLEEELVLTGRPLRPGEVNLVDKCKVPNEYLKLQLSNPDFLLEQHFDGHYFGYDLPKIRTELKSGHNLVVSAVTPDIYGRLKKEFPDAYSVLLLTPPSDLVESSKKRDQKPISPERATSIYNGFLRIRDKFNRPIPNNRYLEGLSNTNAKELILAQNTKSIVDMLESKQIEKLYQQIERLQAENDTLKEKNYGSVNP